MVEYLNVESLQTGGVLTLSVLNYRESTKHSSVSAFNQHADRRGLMDRQFSEMTLQDEEIPRCSHCLMDLAGHRYILRDERPHCIKCFESLFANRCDLCKNIIGADSKDLAYKDRHWHNECFKCCDCRCSLADLPFSMRDERIYCADCFDNHFAERCDGCGGMFKSGMKKFDYKGQQWHEHCFCCDSCRQPIGSKSFVPRDNVIICIPCYEDKFAQRCHKCRGVISKGGITYKDTPWHKECFLCCNCDRALAGERFTSQDDRPYCGDCYGELFAKRCDRCTKPITGFGGTKFISFDERNFHSECFVCYRCSTSLVGRGFLTEVNEILCPECGRV